MSTAYNTLSTEGVEATVEPTQTRKYVLTATVLLSVASAVAFLNGAQADPSPSGTVNPAYNALGTNPVQCTAVGGDMRSYMESLPMWDPRYTNGDNYQAAFYNACYYAFRCCTTTSNGNGCYVSGNFGDKCKGCLRDHAPRMVRDRCAAYLDSPWVQAHNADLTYDDQPSGWTINDLYQDNWVPHVNENAEFDDDPNTTDDDVGFWKQQFQTLIDDEDTGDIGTERHASCWAKYDPTTKRTQDFSDKCFEVLSWCNLLCPRDTPQTADHVMCKHCVLFGFEEGNWSGDVFTNQLNGDSVQNSMCSFFPNRCDCRYQPGSDVNDPTKGFSGYPIGWEYCPKVYMARRYNSGTITNADGNVVQINRMYPGSAGPEDYFASEQGAAELQECLDNAEDFVMRMGENVLEGKPGGCGNDEYAQQQADEQAQLPGDRIDTENPFLGGSPADKDYSGVEASALR